MVCVEACVKRDVEEVIILPFFLSPGRHSQQDIPRLVEAAVHETKTPISYTIAEPIGMDPLLIEILCQRAKDALNKSNDRCL